METKRLADLSDKELIKKAKKIKSDKITAAVITGFTIGVAIYNA